MPIVAGTHLQIVVTCDLFYFVRVSGVDEKLFNLFSAAHNNFVGIRSEWIAGYWMSGVSQRQPARVIVICEGQPR